MVRRADMSEVAGIHDDLYAPIRRCELAQDGHRVVRRGIVDKQVLIVVAGQGVHCRPDLLVYLADVPFLVVTRSQDCQQRHAGSFRSLSTINPPRWQWNRTSWLRRGP